MTIPCKALLLLHVYIMNDNHDYTDVHKLWSKPIGKLVGILTDFQTKVNKKMTKNELFLGRSLPESEQPHLSRPRRCQELTLVLIK